MSAPAPIVTTHAGGARFVTEVRGHLVTVDQPEPAGENAAPTPLELLGVSLGSCVALYAQQYLASRGLSLEGLRVEVRLEAARGPYRIARFAVSVYLDEPLSAGHRTRLERVVKSCPAHNTLTAGALVNVELAWPEMAVG